MRTLEVRIAQLAPPKYMKSYANPFIDSMRLRRAVMRDEKVLRIGANKRKDNQPLSTTDYILPR